MENKKIILVGAEVAFESDIGHMLAVDKLGAAGFQRYDTANDLVAAVQSDPAVLGGVEHIVVAVEGQESLDVARSLAQCTQEEGSPNIEMFATSVGELRLSAEQAATFERVLFVNPDNLALGILENVSTWYCSEAASNALGRLVLEQ